VHKLHLIPLVRVLKRVHYYAMLPNHFLNGPFTPPRFPFSSG
jgi:hypothetical protein